jgi:hypothetical protein
MFGEQEGDFELEIVSLEALHSEASWFSELAERLSAWWTAFVRFFKGVDGSLRLSSK